MSAVPCVEIQMHYSVDLNLNSLLTIVFYFCLILVATIVYRLTEILEAKQEGDIVLKMPDDFPIKNLERFLTDSIDLTDEEGGGMSFYHMDLMIKNNIEDIRALVGNEDNTELVHRLREELGEEGMKKVFLTHHRYIQRDYSCVYSIVKDTYVLRIVTLLYRQNDLSLSTSCFPFFHLKNSKTNYCIFSRIFKSK